MKKGKSLSMRSSVKTLSIKCYDEQLPDGWTATQGRIRSMPKDYHVLGICHDKDFYDDSVWIPSSEKAHYHIIVRTTKNKPFHVQTLLNMLHVVYRKDIDDALFKNHGVETVKNFAHMAMYLTHETEQAELDGKACYELEDIVSNLSIDEVKKVRDGYIRLTTKKVEIDDMIQLDKYAFELGYNLKDFVDWYESLSFAVRSHAKMRTVRESYDLGVEKRVKENNTLNRLCVFVQGKSNVGKTYSAIHALSDKKCLTISGGGTGKFDRLTVTTEAIVIDDDRSPNLLNMTDNYMCQAYKRGNNNPWWTGRYFVVTSNLSFREWLNECGIDTYVSTAGIRTDSEHYRAMLSRFYVCHIENKAGVNKLICDSVSQRGTSSEQLERKQMFIDFRDKFNDIMASYVPSATVVDYSDINS